MGFSPTRQRRLQVLETLGRQGVMKPDLARMVGAMGRDKAADAVRPDANRPARDTSVDAVPRWIQAALNVILGIKLPVHGRMDELTREALRRFQRMEGLTPHGHADEKTLQVLELRVGVRAPRESFHEPIPELLRLQHRPIWLPKPRRNERGPGGARSPDQAPAPRTTEDAVVEAAGPSAERAPRAPGATRLDQAALAHRADAGPDATFLGREAMASVRALAGAGDFAARAAAEAGHDDAGAMAAAFRVWMETQERTSAQDAPAWLQDVRNRARMDPGGAASTLRRQWWCEQFGEVEGW